MCKFSIIVPVYNVEKYINKCLDSIIYQTFDDYEVIIINDGSTDLSVDLISKYLSNPKIRFFSRENKGVASTRNEGIELSNGEYILFVDSDDYIDNNLLLHLNKLLDQDYDLIKFQYAKVNDKGTENYIDEIELNKQYLPADYTMNIIATHKPYDIMCIYLYKRDLFIKNNFQFKPNTYHEDFGLIPLIVLKANKIYVTDFIGYYYNQEGSSITRTIDYNKIVKKANDMLIHFDYLYEEVNKLHLKENVKKYFNSYIANALINKINSLNKKDKKIYIKELKKRNVFNLIIDDTLSRKFKKILLKIKYAIL